MELTKQVVSLDLAKRLKELGVKQKSVFVWALDSEKWNLLWTGNEYGVDGYQEYACAFTVAELGEMLPGSFETEDYWVQLRSTKSSNGTVYGITGYRLKGTVEIEMLTAPTEADARAKMLVYLLENKLITL